MTLTRAKLNLTIAQAKLDVAKATLKQKKQDWDRVPALHASQSITDLEYDIAERDWNVAVAEVQEAEANVKLADLDVADCSL